MYKVLCSTGALLGRPNGRNYRLLGDLSKQLCCDGFEFMMYGSWYPEIEELIKSVKAMNLHIPVIHAQKALGETLCGMKVSFDGKDFYEYRMTEEEDLAAYQKGMEEFVLNLRIAQEFGAEKMVLHLWNGLASDKNLSKNIERFGTLREMARKAGICLMVENVVCNTNDPLTNIGRLHRTYPDIDLVYDTKMAEFHNQLMNVFLPEWEWIFGEGHVKHLHINDYDGGYMDWSNLNVLPIGKGHVDFDGFFQQLSKYKYQGDFTVEATAFDMDGVLNIDMLNQCFESLRKLIKQYL